jgi:anti-sigma28 factor (negative regulator of flagellin synthesis)
MVSSAAKQPVTEGTMMAARKTKPAATPTRKVGKRSGLVRVMFSIEPAQLAALQVEALRRAKERGSFKPDASEIAREALAAWMKRR